MRRFFIISLILCFVILPGCGEDGSEGGIAVDAAGDAATQRLQSDVQKAPNPDKKNISETDIQITKISQNVIKTAKENIAMEMVQFATKAVAEEIRKATAKEIIAAKQAALQAFTEDIQGIRDRFTEELNKTGQTATTEMSGNMADIKEVLQAAVAVAKTHFTEELDKIAEAATEMVSGNITKTAEGEVQAAVAAAKTRFEGELDTVVKTKTAEAKGDITKTAEGEVQAAIAAAKTRFADELDTVVKTKTAEAKGDITKTAEGEVQAAVAAAKTRFADELDTVVKTKTAEAKGDITKTAEGEVQAAVAAAKTRFVDELDKATQAARTEGSDNIQETAETKIQATIAEARIVFKEELNEIVKTKLSEVDQAIAQIAGDVQKDIYTITVQFDGMEVAPFVTWGELQHKQLLVKGSCIKVKESQFPDLDVKILLGIINKQIYVQQLCAPPSKRQKEWKEKVEVLCSEKEEDRKKAEVLCSEHEGEWREAEAICSEKEEEREAFCSEKEEKWKGVEAFCSGNEEERVVFCSKKEEKWKEVEAFRCKPGHYNIVEIREANGEKGYEIKSAEIRNPNPQCEEFY